MFFFNLYAGDFVRPDILFLTDEVLKNAELANFSKAAFFCFFFSAGASNPIMDKEGAAAIEFTSVPASNILIFFVVAFLIVSALVGFN